MDVEIQTAIYGGGKDYGNVKLFTVPEPDNWITEVCYAVRKK